MKTVAVIDIGKTNAKVALVDLARFEEIAVRKTPNIVVEAGLYPHFDVEHLWRFILGGLAELHRVHPVDAISVTTHGATAVLLDQAGELALPVLDYEFAGPDALAEEYGRARPAFSETGSARLPMGLNVGAQLFWQQRAFPEQFAKVATILTYAQYWSYRLTGVATNELTSLGCHTDLWNPLTAAFSTLVEAQGWARLFAPVRKAGDVIGGLLPPLAAAAGLPSGLPVYCGIHDSNASLLPHLLTRRAPFSVVSTGTWVVMLAIGGEQAELDETRDTLINVNALGDPVPSARFMGGRAFSMLVGDNPPPASTEAEARVLAGGYMLLPSVLGGSGPFPSARPRWTVNEADLAPPERLAAVSFHLALMTATCLDLIGARGEIVVEGPFAANAAYLRMLAAATGRPALANSLSSTGTSLGAACLVAGARIRTGAEVFSEAVPEGYAGYARKWQRLTAEHVAASASSLDR
ncbi:MULTISPECIES: FGGY-family carbohydrate kinase [Sinorhizobium]|uniref:FGGY-family carbohydrate kinase n=1 Tax=Sinorhizobium TaxID=28105 RepID=UPI000BE904E8|nr:MULTISPECIES: FGGY-family carbohydrate kinase [Sinorhizobium]PDT51004.1 carbohydrate kinase [Sinorhizobium sp. NG07B]POH25371.1 carbohydrate kinase [Sinorhizobium americanum]